MVTESDIPRAMYSEVCRTAGITIREQGALHPPYPIEEDLADRILGQFQFRQPSPVASWEVSVQWLHQLTGGRGGR